MLRLHSFDMDSSGVFIADVIDLCALLSGIPYITEMHVVMRKTIHIQTGEWIYSVTQIDRYVKYILCFTGNGNKVKEKDYCILQNV